MNTIFGNSDQPLGKNDPDLLGTKPFAKALAERIRDCPSDESVVIALYGAWGEGKSSIKNMCLSFLESEKEKLITLEFSPWQYDSAEQLNRNLFRELAAVIGTTESQGKEIADGLKNLAAITKGATPLGYLLVKNFMSKEYADDFKAFFIQRAR